MRPRAERTDVGQVVTVRGDFGPGKPRARRALERHGERADRSATGCGRPGADACRSRGRFQGAGDPEMKRENYTLRTAQFIV